MDLGYLHERAMMEDMVCRERAGTVLGARGGIGRYQGNDELASVNLRTTLFPFNHGAALHGKPNGFRTKYGDTRHEDPRVVEWSSLLRESTSGAEDGKWERQAFHGVILLRNGNGDPEGLYCNVFSCVTFGRFGAITSRS